MRFNPFVRQVFIGVLSALVDAVGAAAQSPAGHPAAFIVTAGKDTVSIERYARSGNVIAGEWTVVGPNTGVQVHQYVLTLGADDRPVRYEMTLITPNIVRARALRSVRIDYGRDSATIVTMSDTTITRRVPMRDAYPLLGRSMAGLELAVMRLRAAHIDSATISLHAPTGSPTPAMAPVKFVGADTAVVAGAMRMHIDADGRVLDVTAGPQTIHRVPAMDVEQLLAGFIAADAPRVEASQAAIASRVAVALPVAALRRFEGTYGLNATNIITIYLDGASLYFRAGDQRAVAILASSATSFYVEGSEARLDFETDSAGAVTAILATQGASRQRIPKLK